LYAVRFILYAVCHIKRLIFFKFYQGPAVGFTVPPADTELGKVIIYFEYSFLYIFIAVVLLYVQVTRPAASTNRKSALMNEEKDGFIEVPL